MGKNKKQLWLNTQRFAKLYRLAENPNVHSIIYATCSYSFYPLMIDKQFEQTCAKHHVHWDKNTQIFVWRTKGLFDMCIYGYKDISMFGDFSLEEAITA